MYKTQRKTVYKNILVGLLAIMAMAMLQGCLASRETDNDFGVISGQLSAAANLSLLAINENAEISIPADNEGCFSARVAGGIYNLHLQASDGTVSLIRRDVQVDNNMTVTVLDTDIVPIPQVTSVAVPLVYSTSAIIEWETDIESDGYIEFGNNELYGYSSYAITELKTKHRIQLYNLLPASTYHFRVVASRYNLESARSLSRNFTFTTEP
ncbi:MAG: fibronectin type III domain-containing protein [Candidatus Riflebacteria bacterium]|nr:fibronectin type III domain-containing protein [Candidatus Riflebacteria bacterium]